MKRPNGRPLVTNLLLAGASGVGKSTVLRNLGQRLGHRNIRGFYSDVIFEGHEQAGWRLDTFDGSDGGILIHKSIQSERRLGGYGVDLALLERLVESQMALDSGGDLYLVDEIGIVAPWSKRFLGAMDALLDSDVNVVAIIHSGRGGYLKQVRTRPDVNIWEVTLDNRDSMIGDVLMWIGDR